MAKMDMYVIVRNSENGTEYYGFNSKGEFKVLQSPMIVTKCLSHSDATLVCKQMRKSLNETSDNLKIKTVAQAIRDYAWECIQRNNEKTEIAGTNSVEKVLEMFKVSEETVAEETSLENEIADAVAAETNEEFEKSKE